MLSEVSRDNQILAYTLLGLLNTEIFLTVEQTMAISLTTISPDIR